mmetsp:Transcript_20906/g.17462  ORF Transcript_20906/g.17462 Transcript_20906/m.17462 type:complete len:98 (+) Transcript_20906:40-333(+)
MAKVTLESARQRHSPVSPEIWVFRASTADQIRWMCQVDSESSSCYVYANVALSRLITSHGKGNPRVCPAKALSSLARDMGVQGFYRGPDKVDVPSGL